MAAGMEIRIIEVPSQGNMNTTPLSTSSEDIKSQIAQDLKNNTGSNNRFELPNFRNSLQNKLQQAFQKKENQKKSIQKNNTSTSNQTSQGSNSNASSAAAGTMGLANMGLGVLGNAATTVFDNATIGASFGKYGGNQVALRKASNVKNTAGKVGGMVNSSLQGAAYGAQLGAVLGPWGVAIGAAVGLVAGVANQALENSKAARELAMQQAEWAAESTKALDRMGYNGGR